MLAAVVVIQGPRLPTDELVPSLPAEAATKTPAAAAFMNARLEASVNGSPPPVEPMEKLMTSTPSRTDWSMALTMSESVPVP